MICGLFAQSAWADQPPTKTEAEKGQRIKKILAAGPRYEPLMPGNLSVCSGLLRALKRGDKLVRFIEPDVRTDDPNDPRLARYHSCKDYEHGNPDIERHDYALLEWTVGHRGFRLYRLDLDRNPSNGLEELIYGEVDWVGQKPLGGSGGYAQVDFKKCEVVGGMPVYQDQQADLTLRDNYNAVIYYRKQYWIIDLFVYNSAPELRGLNIWSAAPTKRPFACGWLEPVPIN